MTKIIKIFGRRPMSETKNGYALLELLFYIALFVLLTLMVVDSMITMAKSFKKTAIETELVQSGSIMERISREIKKASAINSISNSDLTLNTKDENGVNKTVRFVLNGSNLELRENDILTGNLNTPSISVHSLIFTQINTIKGQAVKIFLTLEVNEDISGRTEDFYDTVVLRGSY